MFTYKKKWEVENNPWKEAVDTHRPGNEKKVENTPRKKRK